MTKSRGLSPSIVQKMAADGFDCLPTDGHSAVLRKTQLAILLTWRQVKKLDPTHRPYESLAPTDHFQFQLKAYLRKKMFG